MTRMDVHEQTGAQRLAGRALTSESLFVMVGAAVLVWGAVSTSGFVSVANFKAILASVGILGIVSVGMTCVTLSGNLFSLTLGATLTVTSMSFLTLLNLGVVAAIALSVLLGVVVCGLQGLLIGAAGANPIVVTIAAGSLQLGVASKLTDASTVYPGGKGFDFLAGNVSGIPASVFVLVAVVIVVEAWLRLSRRGQELYLTGENESAARAAGLRVTGVSVAAFMIAGACAAIGGVLQGAASQNATLFAGIDNYTFNAIAVVLVGGVAATGGRGSPRAGRPRCILHRRDLRHGASTRLWDGCPDRGDRRLCPDRGRGDAATRGGGIMSTFSVIRRLARTAYTGGGSVACFAMAVIFVVVSLRSDTAIDATAVYFVLQSFATYGLLALAVGIGMVAGRFDISTLGMFALGGMVAVKMGGDQPLLGLAAAVGIGMVSGIVQGAIVVRLGINTMAVTLGGYLILVGLCSAIGDDKSVSYTNVPFSLDLESQVLQIFSIHSIVVLLVFAVTGIVFVFTRIGRNVRAIGGDERSSRIAGVPVNLTLLSVFATVGMLAGLGGALSAYGLGTASADPGFSPLIFAATAAIIGGVSFAGGKGTSAGIALGALALSLMQSVFGVLAAPDWVTSVVTGGLLTLAALAASPRFDARVRRRTKTEQTEPPPPNDERTPRESEMPREVAAR